MLVEIYILHKFFMMIEQSKDEIRLLFRKQSGRCIWSLFDEGGTEIKTGTLSDGEIHLIPVSGIDPGIYQICVIDGDKLHKSNISIT
ncbi:MAG: hypothetical protein Fur0041_15240 [Bacteroidia bacterium]